MKFLVMLDMLSLSSLLWKLTFYGCYYRVNETKINLRDDIGQAIKRKVNVNSIRFPTELCSSVHAVSGAV